MSQEGSDSYKHLTPTGSGPSCSEAGLTLTFSMTKKSLSQKPNRSPCTESTPQNAILCCGDV